MARERETKAVLSKSRDCAVSIALLPVLQKPGIGIRRIETPDLAPEFSLFTRQINTADTPGANRDFRLALALTHKVFPIIMIFELF
jgi:hypothetical protein